MTAEAFAPAKINLTLHVTGQREDGLHLLDSLVVFADVGDSVRVTPADDWSFTVTGPRAGYVPQDESNLVMRAARMTGGMPCAITLDKHLPIASGIGGGSSDAAACLRALKRLDGRAIPRRLERLGADVPVCLRARPCRMTGIGETLKDVPVFPPLSAILVNPGLGVATVSVFKALRSREHPPMAAELPSWTDAADLVGWLATQRNDLEPPACRIVPEIEQTLTALRATEGCLLARMSGSGATCFALYDRHEVAESAAMALRDSLSPRWITVTRLGRPKV
ncbi:4-(cytidine 5'-diphospho)-2-C-methyl-D-erythritol kinase [Oceaniglobus trochenteri]|uniref:4-(cytidine 5'-diphospho)-2-C-methyl-D-erythritol kinase n=1 Tax=Oceaniglobus trochenteri TaxID=2763260 RepID=UPI001CFFAB92|nr:4-(cytidine 5'-diphospho)-2-C-methyl-D-erythritol kinase [Oceaniglobus trochenteri]